MCRIECCLALLAFAIMLSDQLMAREAGDTDSNVDTLMEEITVTARKHEEGLQSAPISISAFSGDSLAVRGMTNISQIQNITPNLTIYSNTSEGAASNSAGIFIRGIGQSDFVPTIEPGVALYVDGVYMGRSVGSVLELIDIERVEVLRGPQGTLFGRNSTGGAVNIITDKPHDTFAVDASATYGTDDRINGSLSVNIPIAKNLHAKLSGTTLNQDGYVKNPNKGFDLGDDDTLAGRAAILWLPVDDLTVDLRFDYSRDREHGVPYVNEGNVFVDPTQPGGPNFTFISNVLASALTGCDGTFANPAGSLSNPGCVNDQYVGRNTGLGDYFSDVDAFGGSVSIEWQINEQLKIRSISAYRNLDSNFAYDADGTQVFIVDGVLDVLTQEQVTEEVQLSGNAFADKLNWIAGFFYFQEDGKNVNPVDFLPVSLRSGGFYDNDSVAGFAQGTYHLTDALHFTAGVRYTDDTKRFLPDQYVTGGLVTLGIPGFPFIPVGTRTLPFVETTTKADDWSKMFNLAYDWSPQLMVYTTYSEGFKGGGFHQRVFPPLPETPTFDPEYATSYEIGFKYANAANTFVLNGAGFYTDYEGMQVTVFTAIAPVVDNAGNGEISGFELETRWVPFSDWFVEASVGYLNTGYKSVDPTTGLTGDERLPRVPNWNLSASLTREFGLGELGTMTPRLDWSYRSSVEYDTFNTPFIEGDSYYLLNGNLSWKSVDSRYGLTLRAENLTGRHYYRQRVYQEGFGNILGFRDRGRQWMLTVAVSF